MSEAGADPEVTTAPRTAWKIVFLALVVFALAAGTRAITRSNAAPLARSALADRVVQTVAPAAAPRLTAVALPVLAPRPARKVRPAPSRILYAPTPTATATPTSTSTPFTTPAPTVAAPTPPPPPPTPVRTARPAPTAAPTFDYNGTFNTSH